nr:EAL domain-containing protein [Mangrovicoccus algicola]
MLPPSLLPGLRSALTKHPSPEDVSSVVAATGFGATVTALNAAVYALGCLGSGAGGFLAGWLAVVVVLSAVMARRSARAVGRVVTRVSRRAARRLLLSSVLFALPWAVLQVQAIGLRGPGEPMLAMLVSIGMLTGGAFMLHRAFVAALAFQGVILGATILSFHLGDWPQAGAVTVYAMAYGLSLSYFAHAAGETARQRDKSVTLLSTAVDGLSRARDENYRLANIDTTTGLLNRKAFDEALRQATERRMADGAGFALLLLDLDRFKNVNDLFGHAVGDELLAEIAARLRAGLGAGDVIGRLGGDEFAILLPGVKHAADIAAIAARLIEALNRPARLAGRQIHPGTSIGAALCPADATESADLLLKADLALNRAKECGRGLCVQFDALLQRRVVEADRLEAGLRSALDEGRVHVAYQPRVTLEDGRICGAEALVRWTAPDGERIPPDVFLPIASERGLLPRLSRVIAETVAADMLAWRRAGLHPGKIALNLHPDDLKTPELLMETMAMFETRGITGAELMLEITEGCFTGRGTDRVAMVLDTLADRGYDLALDDFGTGHAALAHLRKIPVAELKIDRSFVAGIGTSRNDRAIVAAIAEIARGMEIRALAEGVETEEQRAALAAMGVTLGQGYLWSHPLGAKAFAALLDSDRRRTG